MVSPTEKEREIESAGLVEKRNSIDLNRLVRVASLRRSRLEGNKNISSMDILGLPKVTRLVY